MIALWYRCLVVVCFLVILGLITVLMLVCVKLVVFVCVWLVIVGGWVVACRLFTCLFVYVE